ncbi:MAG: hypothetical protein M0R03_12425 [Novosphingobium sp.]|nr:hypothetical protein [Novosphingobium sp.]
MATRVRVKKQSSKKLSDEIKEYVLPIASNHLDIAGQLTVEEMQGQIRSSIQRPGSTGNLENSIFAERDTLLSVGIGNISYLDANAAYWASLNYGSSHLVGKQMPKGTFSPGIPMPDAGSFRDGRFYKGLNQGNKTYAPIITKPIEPHNYIERTEAKLSVIAERATK